MQNNPLHNPDILDAIINTISEGVITVTETGIILACNPSVERILGYRPQELLGKSLNILIPPRFTNHDRKLADYTKSGEAHTMGYGREVVGQHKDGHEVPIEVGLSKVLVDGKHILVSVIRDITERKKAEEELQKMAWVDSLTGLFNRHFFRIQLQKSLLEAERYKRVMGLFFCDLNRFKGVNDTYGHTMGDMLLVEVAARLKHNLRTSDIIARIGGDEFVFITHESDHAACRDIAEKIIHAIAAPFSLINHKIEIGISIGITVYPQDGATADILVKHADAAMYMAKESPQSSYRFYQPELLAVKQQ